jgi:GAF domain-containing protein
MTQPSRPQPGAADHSADALQPDLRYLGAPPDPGVSDRVANLRRLGVALRPDEEFDQMARELAEQLGVPDGMAMVNFIGVDNQYFAGLHTPDGTTIEREMSREDGWCPHTVLREVPLPLSNVASWSRFQTNRVAEEFGIESYIGAPLPGRGEDGNLGTICLIDSQTHDWNIDHVRTISAFAEKVADLIYRRAGIADEGPR